MRGIAISIVLLDSCISIITIDFYINFSRCILIEDTLILICKIFVNIVL